MPPRIDNLEPKAVKGKRLLKKNDTDKDVKKSIHDNLKDMSTAELHGTTDTDGMTCYQRLAAQKRKHRDDPANHPIGSTFYKELRQTFRSEEHPANRLKATDHKEPIDDALLKAMMLYKKNSADRGPLNSFIAHAQMVNQHELVGILQYFIQLSPGTSAEQFRFCYTILQFLARIDAPNKFPDEIVVVKGHVDQVLLAAWGKQQGKALNRRSFLEVRSDVWPLVLPKDDTECIMAHEGAWADVQSSLVQVTMSSRLGAELFGLCCSQVLAENVDKVVSAGIATLFENPITKIRFENSKRKVLEQLAQSPLNGLPEKRAIELQYRGTCFPSRITCLGDQVEQMYDVALKSHAAGHGLIPALFCEAELVDKPSAVKLAVDDCLLRGCRAARESANSGLEGEEGKDGIAIAKYLTKFERRFVTLDVLWKVDQQWITSMVGEAGEKKLQEKCLAALPGEGVKISLASAIQQVRLLNATSLCRFCSVSAQAAVQNVLDTLGLMLAGKPPNIGINATPFLKLVLCRLQFFVRFGSGASEVSGKLAAEAHFANLHRQSAGALSIADIEPLVIFHWLLSAEQQELAHNLCTDVLVAARATILVGSEAAAASSSSTGSSKEKVMKKKPGHKSELASAMEMFG
ncbi:unnamed protein product [Polarella glacialis]|uniref:Uncharacterized protein n=1 Tax=Polarella glacialis TaxID=89957 RepID=A0A813FQH3_POLGL|nr:unnamed protein product [Polarella glacialis]